MVVMGRIMLEVRSIDQGQKKLNMFQSVRTHLSLFAVRKTIFEKTMFKSVG